jgi:hypothetical protein
MIRAFDRIFGWRIADKTVVPAVKIHLFFFVTTGRSYHRHRSMQFSLFFAEDSQLNGTDTIIRQLEKLASGIDYALAALRSLTNQDTGAVAATSAGVVQRKRRRMSAAARKRIGDATRKRWAALRAARGLPAPATTKRRKYRLSSEGRKRIIDAARRRATNRIK